MISLTQGSLDKLEALFGDLGYKLRYEKGSFRTGACVLQNSKVVVVNKFSTVDMKVVSLLQILETMEVDEDLIQEKLKPFYQNIKKTKISI
ncbi:hypothetical protein M3B46_11455 [Sphingobacterium daejeonense]|jgi:hypothetical protein|uniref:hypothetical protein n=1 Tax=Sphingobacterium daejeonense TaxID=371142 RepID=UPI0021A47651|nr:hypothetical protein [Sphingobacterium daejeonense]MCT1531615.1 hypothetical protein [Sphingobacterium daejeonense]